MKTRTCDVAMLAVCLPTLDGIPKPSPAVRQSVLALCDSQASASVAELHAVAKYLGELAAHPGLPAEARRAVLDVQAALLGRRVRNQHGRTGRRRGRGAGDGSGGVQFSFTATAAAGVAVR